MSSRARATRQATQASFRASELPSATAADRAPSRVTVMLSQKPTLRRTRPGDEDRPTVAIRESRAGAQDESERKTGTDASLNLGVPIARGRKHGGPTLSTAPVASPAAASLDLPLVVGVSTRALFELEEENGVFERLGEAAYTDLQRERELKMLEPGCAFEFIQRLLALNPAEGPQLVEVVLLSRNAPDLALRAFRSCESHGLAISAGSFTSGRPIAPFLAAWGVDLFLSKGEDDVCAAVEAGRAAAILGPVPLALRPEGSDEVCFGLDGDAVTFGAESEAIFRLQGLEIFRASRTAQRAGSLNPWSVRRRPLAETRRTSATVSA